jgi:hypothetical protein
MPVILTSPGEVDLWLEGHMPEALKLHLALKVVAKGEKEDRAAEAAWRGRGARQRGARHRLVATLVLSGGKFIAPPCSSHSMIERGARSARRNLNSVKPGSR